MIRQLKRRQWLMVGAAIMAVFAAGAACGGGSASKRADSSAGSTGQTQLKASSGGQPVEQAVNGAVRDPGKVQSGVDGDPGANTDALRGAPNDATGGGANPLALPSQLDRKIIMTATLDLSADEVSKRFEDIGNIATSAGGFIASSTFGNANDRQTASVTIRVPAASYQRAIQDLRKLGDVNSEQSNANDVTEQYTDLQSRLRNLKATEDQYLAFLLKAADLNQVLTVQDRLNVTRADIEQVQGRINLVDHQSDLATITVHLSPPIAAKPEPPKTATTNSPLEVAADSFQASLVVLLGLATVVLAVAAFSWWLVPVLIVAYVITRRQLRTPRDRRPEPPVASA